MLKNDSVGCDHRLDLWMAFKSAVSQLGALGRYLNVLARAAERGQPVPGPGREQAFVMIKICEALRDHFKAALLANLRSWEVGYDDRE